MGKVELQGSNTIPVFLTLYSYVKKRCQKFKKPISQDYKVIWEFLKLLS